MNLRDLLVTEHDSPGHSVSPELLSGRISTTVAEPEPVRHDTSVATYPDKALEFSSLTHSSLEQSGVKDRHFHSLSMRSRWIDVGTAGPRCQLLHKAALS